MKVGVEVKVNHESGKGNHESRMQCDAKPGMRKVQNIIHQKGNAPLQNALRGTHLMLANVKPPRDHVGSTGPQWNPGSGRCGSHNDNTRSLGSGSHYLWGCGYYEGAYYAKSGTGISLLRKSWIL